MLKRKVKRLLVICLALMVCACTTQTAKNIKRDQTMTVEQLISELRQAEQQVSPERDRRLLAIAADFVVQDDYNWAYKTIQLVSSDQLNDSEYIDYSVVASNIFMQRQEYLKAQALLTNLRLDQLLDQQTIEDQQIIRLRRANLFSQLGDIAASVNERVVLSTILLPGEQEVENQEALWRELTSLPVEQLQSLANTTTSILQGWYQLAIINQQYQSDLDTQYSMINAWVVSNPNHPASYQLPEDLQLLQQLIEQQPKKIALLLPVQGKLAKAGRAIRDGFFAAYYQAVGRSWKAPVVSVLDTSSTTIDTVYDQAIADGAELIIGPLSKDGVASLQARSQLPVATLALNYLDEPIYGRNLPEIAGNFINSESEYPIGDDSSQFDDNIVSDSEVDTGVNNLFQFGLSLDGEAVQAAERAWLEGHRNALIIASDSNWSMRTAQAFANQWQALGGQVVNYSQFTGGDEYSKVVKLALNIDKSQQRANALKRLFGSSFEFETRRRADIDMIFLVARTQQARQIKPALNFYYADKIPVYSTSQIFLSMQQDFNSNDLNGIRFTTLPWVFDDDMAVKKSLQDNLTIDNNYASLYAMGTDAFLLFPRLRQLQQIADTTLYGATGALQLAQNNRITRKQQWAEIYRGQARPLTTAIMDDSLDNDDLE